MIKLKNKYLNVRISEVGAEIKSIKLCGHEQMWQGEKESWQRTAPTLFPFCGRLRDGRYRIGDTEYECMPHGFAKDAEFTVVSQNKRCAVLKIAADEETKKIYPFDFEFTVTFTLLRKSITVKYNIKNKGKETMYFSCGSHESYLCDGGMQNYELLFDRRESLENSVVDENGLISGKTRRITCFSKTLALYEDYLKDDSLVFRNMVSRKVVLRNIRDGRRVKIEFPGFDNFVIWSLPGKDYVCLEPWAGLPDFADFDGELKDKKGILKLRGRSQKTLMHKITFMPSL